MFAREGLEYQPIPLPDRHGMRNDEMADAARRFYAFMKRRHTVRDFSTRPVARETIEDCLLTGGLAPSGANHQPWHFVAIANADLKHQIRLAAEEEEREFYAGGAGEEWIKALEPIRTNHAKPHLDLAPWLIVIFAERYGVLDDGTRYKNYYVNESVGIATGFLIAALHQAGLASLTHTPNPMRFLNEICGRPPADKPMMILAVGHPAADATVPRVAKIKKPPSDLATFVE